LPDELTRAALLLDELRGAGRLERLGMALSVSRRGGHHGYTLVAFALAFLLAGVMGGIRPFWTRHKRALGRLAKVAGCRALPSSGALSRALHKLDAETVGHFTSATLCDVESLPELLRHPSVVHRDALGNAWHVLDVDPTVQAFRQRTLPEGCDLPAPERIAPGVPGYTGHKRGELRIRHVPVQHAGAGLWLAYRHIADNEAASSFVGPLVQSALAQLAAQSGITAGEVVIRCDGEFGSAGAMHALQALGVHFVTRISRYHLLRRPEVAQALAGASWSPVRSSTETGRREAADVGLVTLHPDAKSVDAGGPPVTVRLVVVRSRASNHRTHGEVIDDYRYEMFATTLPADRWPAAAVAELYAGRAAMENRFAQEDAEFGLGRTFSYHAPGQAWMVSVGLYLWNHLTCAGFRHGGLASPPSPPRNPPSASVPEPAEAPPAAVGAVPASDTSATGTSEPPVETPNEVRVAPTAHPFPEAPPDDLRRVGDIIQERFSDLLRLDGWSWDPSSHVVRCPTDRRLMPFSVARAGRNRPRPQLILRTDASACEGCAHRDDCFPRSRPGSYKQTARCISEDEADFLRSFLKAHPPARAQRRPKPPRPKPAQERDGSAQTARSRPLFEAAATASPAPRPCTAPSFQPARARREALINLQDVTVNVYIGRSAKRRAGCSLDIADPDRRHRTRHTYSYRQERWLDHGDVHLFVQRACVRGRRVRGFEAR
jgi:hypothetical protein